MILGKFWFNKQWSTSLAKKYLHNWEFKICQVFTGLWNCFCEMASSLTAIIRPCSLHGKQSMMQYVPTAHILYTIHEVEERATKLQAAKKETNKFILMTSWAY